MSQLTIDSRDYDEQVPKQYTLDGDVHDYLHRYLPDDTNKSSVVREAIIMESKEGDIEYIDDYLSELLDELELQRDHPQKNNSFPKLGEDDVDTEKKRISITLNPEIVHIIDENARSPRKKGEYVSYCVRKYARRGPYIEQVKEVLDLAVHELKERDVANPNEGGNESGRWQGVGKTMSDYLDPLKEELQDNNKTYKNRNELEAETAEILEEEVSVVSEATVEKAVDKIEDELLERDIIQEWMAQNEDYDDSRSSYDVDVRAVAKDVREIAKRIDTENENMNVYSGARKALNSYTKSRKKRIAEDLVEFANQS